MLRFELVRCYRRCFRRSGEPGVARLRSARRAAPALAMHAFVLVMSTLLIVLPIPYRPAFVHADDGGSTAGAAVSEDDESFNFAEQSPAGEEKATADASQNALKPRTAPVSASGAFFHSVAIDVPPGRSGMTPSLALGYTSDSYRKDSPVGAGWSFEVPSISRDVRGGFPPRAMFGDNLRYQDDATTFSGPSGRLMRITRNEGLTVTTGAWIFAPQREHSPVRYEYVRSEDRWIEHLPSGVKRFYGARGERRGRVINELGTHQWLLLAERDPDGNTIEYDYHNLDGKTGQGRVGNWQAAQAVPVVKSVKWGANEVAGSPHIFRVQTEVQPYKGQLDMLNGHVVLTSKITKIKVFGPDPVGNGAGERLYWDYTLSLSKSEDTYRHLLRSVTRQGYDPSSTALNPPVQGDPIVHAFAYSGNGGASFGTKGDAATCNTATRAAYSSLANLAGDPEIYRSGFQLNLTPGRHPVFENASVEELNKTRPMDSLSPEYRGAGYRFEDFDADSDIDVIYHPAGLGSPSSRWLQHKSYFDNGTGFSPQQVATREASKGTVKGISGNLLISSFADVDADTDLDAVAFPLQWSKPALTVGEDRPPLEPHFTADDDPFDPKNIAADQHRAILLEAYSPTARTGIYGAACTPTKKATGHGEFMMYALPSLGMGWNPLLPGGSGWSPQLPWTPIGTTDPDGNLPWGDPMLPAQERIAQILGPACVNWTPWWWRVGEVNILHADLVAQLAYNSSRGPAGGQQEVVIEGWPAHVEKVARWGYDPRITGCSGKTTGYCDAFTALLPDRVEATWAYLSSPSRTATEPRLVWNASYNQYSDFYAPMSDLNGDGRADIALLKSMAILNSKTTFTNFVPRIFSRRAPGSRGIAMFLASRSTSQISCPSTGPPSSAVAHSTIRPAARFFRYGRARKPRFPTKCSTFCRPRCRRRH